MRRWASILGTTIFLLAVANFAAFFVVALILGGDAVNGKAEDGRYFLSSHGHLTEVSHGVWLYSRIHTISVWVTHPLGIFVGGGLLTWANRKPKNG